MPVPNTLPLAGGQHRSGLAAGPSEGCWGLLLASPQPPPQVQQLQYCPPEHQPEPQISAAAWTGFP